MYLGDMLKQMIDVVFKVLRIKKPNPSTCGCEQRRITLNLIGWHIKNRIREWWFTRTQRQPAKVTTIRTSIDLDNFECQWQGVASGIADKYVTSNQDTYDSLKLSGYNVEMKQ